MSTITTTTNLYRFGELSDKAKEAARDWWREAEAQDPAWHEEHAGSIRAARKFIRSYEYADTLAGLYETVRAFRTAGERCPWTGYYADEVAIDAILEAERGEVEDLGRLVRHVEDAMSESWDDEVEDRMEDENVDKSIRASGCEFTGNGCFAG